MLSPGSGNTVIKSKLISRRMFLLTAAKTVVLVGLVGRLISLQINQATKYKSLSDKNRFREWKLAPERGVIKDFFDKEIAIEAFAQTTFSCSVVPLPFRTFIKILDDDFTSFPPLIESLWISSNSKSFDSRINSFDLE